MKPIERLMSAINLSIPDRVPVVPQLTYAASRVTSIKFIDGIKSSEKMAKALLDAYRFYGYDGIYVGWESSFNLVAEAMGCKLKFFEDSPPTVIENIVKNEEDLDKVKIPDPYKDGRLPLNLNALKIVKLNIKDETLIFSYVPSPFTLSSLLMGIESFLTKIIKNPKLIHELNKICLEACKAFAEAKIENGANVITVSDPIASISVISPEMFKDFSKPYLSNILSYIRRKGGIPSLHICGETTPILEQFLEMDTKIVELDSKVDLSIAKNKIGKKICIMGNINTSILRSGKIEEIEMEVKKCIEKAAMNGGYILSSGCEVPIDTPIENIKALVASSKKYGAYTL
ncbi:MAG: uroporphyrinogen decarboxylase family protein [Nitrososphaerota archaeon]